MLVAASLGDRRDAGEFLNGSGVCEALTVFAKCSEQARGEDLTGAWKVFEKAEVWETRATVRNLTVEALNTYSQSAKLRKKGCDDGQSWFDDGWVGGEGAFGLDRGNSAVNDVFAPDTGA